MLERLVTVGLLLPVGVSIPGFVGSLYPVDQACSIFFMVRANFAKFGLNAGSMSFDTKNVDWIIICTIVCTIVNFPLYFSIRVGRVAQSV